MSESSSNHGLTDATRSTARRLSLVFALAYLTHGISTQFGLIAQPLQFYMKQGLNMSASDVSAYLAVMMLPWVLKPFYGLACDFVPLFGYKRKSYLCLVNLATAVAFGVMAVTESLPVVLACLMVSAVGMAASTAVTVGLAVEAGKENGKARDFFAEQTFVYYGAIMIVSVAGGVLCLRLVPEMALHTAAALAAVPPLLMSFVFAILVKEKKSVLNRTELKVTFASAKTLMRTRAFWLVALFVWFWDFSPSFGVPLYFHETNVLNFSQGLVGQLAGWNAGGMMLGAVLYRFVLREQSIRTQLYLAVLLGAVGTAGYLLLSTPETGVALELIRGTTSMVAILAIYALGADICPPRMEVTLMATLLAVRSLAMDGSTFIGGWLYTNAFHNQLASLVTVAALATAVCAVFIPFLPSGKPKSKE